MTFNVIWVSKLFLAPHNTNSTLSVHAKNGNVEFLTHLYRTDIKVIINRPFTNAAVNQTSRRIVWYRKVRASSQQLSSVKNHRGADLLKPFNQDSYNNFWRLQLTKYHHGKCIHRWGGCVIFIYKNNVLTVLSDIPFAPYPGIEELQLWWVFYKPLCFILAKYVHLTTTYILYKYILGENWLMFGARSRYWKLSIHAYIKTQQKLSIFSY